MSRLFPSGGQSIEVSQPNERLIVIPNKLFSSVQLLSRVWLSATPWIVARQASLSFTNSQSLLKLHWVSDAI